MINLVIGGKDCKLSEKHQELSTHYLSQLQSFLGKEIIILYYFLRKTKTMCVF